MTYGIEITEEQRQMLLLALADKSLSAPGFARLLGEIADRVPAGRAMFEDFRRLRQDVVKVENAFPPNYDGDDEAPWPCGLWYVELQDSLGLDDEKTTIAKLRSWTARATSEAAKRARRIFANGFHFGMVWGGAFTLRTANRGSN